jgi:type VI secretion system protein ImpL
MTKILRLIFNRWVLTALGLAAIGLLIWIVGPLLAIADYHPLESVMVRAVLIGLVVLAVVGKALWRVFKTRRANAQLMEGLIKQAPGQAARPDASAEEVATLSKRFEEAVDVLKKAKLGERKRFSLGGLFGQQYVYELPWYIFIGAPGSGKTTALVNSGLQFPLAEKFGQEAIRGVGGTRNCDWWFTDEAVLIDTAGRYTTQESNQEVDRSAWSGFLELLKKYRPRRPINGVILTVSVADLLQQNAAQRELQAAALRQRIQELHEQLNIRFPIYVLVTKADLLAGFSEFFEEFGKEERAQPWGMTFPLAGNPGKPKESDAQPLAGFGAELNLLEDRLNARLVDRMQQERDPAKRALLYLFPQQFNGLKNVLAEFLGQVFAPSRFQVQPLLRSVHFASGTQEGNPIDRVMGGLARALRLEGRLLAPPRGSGKSFFLTRLVKEVVFAEAGLAGTNLKWERRRALLQWSAIAVTCAVVLTACLAWAVSYTRNKGYVAEVSSKTQAVAKEVESQQALGSTDVVSLLPVLQAVQQLGSTASVPGTSAPWSMSFGLYQGGKLAAAADSAYRRLLQDAFLPRLALRIEEVLRNEGRNNPELLYEALKAYVMLNDARHFDAAALKAFVAVDWENSLPRTVTTEQRAALEAHLDTLLERGQLASPLPPDATLIADVRNTIAQTPIARRIYNRVRREGVGTDFPEFTIAQRGGSSATLVFARASGEPLTKGVPGLFSFDGYYKAFVAASERVTKQLAAEEGWVLGLDENQKQTARLASAVSGASATEKDNLLNEVRRLYLTDYANTWETFVNDIRLVRGGNLTQSIQTARVLAAPDSPLPTLLRAIVREVSLVRKNDADKSLLDKGEEKLRDKADTLKKFFGTSTARPTAEVESRPERIVDDRFDALRRMVTAPVEGQPAPVDAAVGLVKELLVLLTATDSAVKGGNAPPPSDLPTKLKVEAGQMAEPVRSMLTTLASAGASQALGATRGNLSDALAAEVGDFCQKAIAGRYPFVKSSTRDVTQDDFSRLFAPGGLLDDFFQKRLAPYVDTSTKPWSFRQVGEAKMGDTSGALIQFQRAQIIRDVFFRSGRAAGMRLDFKPLEMDASITQFILDVDGQLVKYSHGPQVPMPVQWPGPKGSTQVRLQLSPAAGGSSGKVFEGPWALFRMLDGMQIGATGQPEKFSVTFNVDGRKTQFEVVTSSVQNPFRLRELEQFQCPTRL